MNYYNPYYYMMSPSVANYPIGTGATGTGLFSRLTGGLRNIGWSGILNNTQRTLGIINQTIPLVKQATPMFRNARTMFQIMNEFKKDDAPLMQSSTVDTKNVETIAKKTEQAPKQEINYHNGPTFFQ